MSSYPVRLRIFLGLIVCHFVLVLMGAANSDYHVFGPLQNGLLFYGAASGAANNYGFFAPGVYNQLRALFDVTDAAGKTTTVTLETGASHEADLRVGNIIEQFASESIDSEDLQHQLSASLAATIFNRMPEARKVKVRLEDYEAISMAEYRAGERASWQPVYSATYEAPVREKGAQK